ncbi:hypothetical protein JZ751_011175 [Albula glossodonta]|uniref:Uncharacterized protein n=1 Tax=Albula glossodonta TaxID=121402 RepID=A0A8T2NVX8_9TELE|nr:hypothetical protein JZ751_011175 [Albula glossodonta]
MAAHWSRKEFRLIGTKVTTTDLFDHLTQLRETLIVLHGVMKRLSSPASSAISTLAPSMVPMVRAPFSMNFMLPVPEASVPAVEICSDRSAAGITEGGRGRDGKGGRKRKGGMDGEGWMEREGGRGREG